MGCPLRAVVGVNSLSLLGPVGFGGRNICKLAYFGRGYGREVAFLGNLVGVKRSSARNGGSAVPPNFPIFTTRFLCTIEPEGQILVRLDGITGMRLCGEVVLCR